MHHYLFIVMGRLPCIFWYVDDLILTGSDDMVVQNFVAQLGSHFSIKDLGTLSYFLGVEVVSCFEGLRLT